MDLDLQITWKHPVSGIEWFCYLMADGFKYTSNYLAVTVLPRQKEGMVHSWSSLHPSTQIQVELPSYSANFE